MHYTNHAFVFETPAQWEMVKRVRTHMKAVCAAIDLKNR
jgi:hypothetical protein